MWGKEGSVRERSGPFPFHVRPKIFIAGIDLALGRARVKGAVMKSPWILYFCVSQGLDLIEPAAVI